MYTVVTLFDKSLEKLNNQRKHLDELFSLPYDWP